MFQMKSFFAGCAALLLAVGAVAGDRPGFPRTGSLNISAPHNYDDPGYQAALAKVDMAVLSYWPGWNSGKRMTMEQVLRNIKAMNPDSKIFLYQNSMMLDGKSASVQELRAKADQMRWWAYPSGTSGGRILTTYGSKTGKEIYITNTTLFTPRDSNGYQWWEYHARWAVANYNKTNPSIAGLFEDNVFWRPRIDADWNRDGVTDPKDGANAGKWLREGYRERFALMHKLMPGKYIIGNVADWGNKKAVLTEFQGMLDGGVMEGILGTTYSPEQWNSWAEMMRWYRKVMDAMRDPKLVMFDQHGDPNDYQAMRYGLASCLLDDGYYAFSNDGYSGVHVFDEYQADLGQAVSPPSLTPWQKGVYRRDFENGIALVNPKGNGPVEVELETEFRHLAGKQAPAVNNGQTTRKVQLKDRDGIILLRSKGLPSAPKLIAVH
jgi:hypothetical protein